MQIWIDAKIANCAINPHLLLPRGVMSAALPCIQVWQGTPQGTRCHRGTGLEHGGCVVGQGCLSTRTFSTVPPSQAWMHSSSLRLYVRSPACCPSVVLDAAIRLPSLDSLPSPFPPTSGSRWSAHISPRPSRPCRSPPQTPSRPCPVTLLQRCLPPPSFLDETTAVPRDVFQYSNRTAGSAPGDTGWGGRRQRKPKCPKGQKCPITAKIWGGDANSFLFNFVIFLFRRTFIFFALFLIFQSGFACIFPAFFF